MSADTTIRQIRQKILYAFIELFDYLKIRVLQLDKDSPEHDVDKLIGELRDLDKDILEYEQLLNKTIDDLSEPIEEQGAQGNEL